MTAPQLTVLSPGDGAKVGQHAALQAGAVDNVGVTEYRFEYSQDDGQTWILLGASADGRLTWNTTALAQRPYQVRATALDAAGNPSAPWTRTYVVDNVAPLPEALSAQSAEFAVVLTWTGSAAADFAYYRLGRSQTVGGPYTPINGAMTQTAFTDSSVVVGTTYYYVLTVFDHVGNASLYSNETFAAPGDDATPPVISGLAPPAGTRAAVTIPLSVNARDNVAVTGYRFEYTTEGNPWELIAEGASSQTAWDVSGLASGPYEVRVTVYDAAGQESSLVRQYQVDHIPPGTPACSRVDPDQVALTVAWDPVVCSDFHHYELLRSRDGSPFELILVHTTSTVYIDRDVETGHTYAYQVVAADDVSNRSEPSESASGEPLADTTPPTVRSLEPAEGTHVKGVVDVWATAIDNVRVQAFTLYCAAAGTEDWSLVGEDLAPAALANNTWRGTVAWDTSSMTQGAYVVRALATDEGGNTHFLQRTYIVDREAPASPEAPTVEDPRQGNRLSVSWPANAEPDLSGYRLYRSVVSGQDYALVAECEQNSYQDDGLEHGTTYYYVVTALDTAGNESLASAESSGTASAQTDLSVTAVSFVPAVPVLGRQAEVHISVANEGPAATAANVYFYDGHSALGPVGMVHVELAAGATRDVTMTWVPATSGLHHVSARVGDASAEDVDPINDAAEQDVPVNTPPVAEAGADRQGGWDTPISFDGLASTDADGSIVAYNWSFGDGESAPYGVTTHSYRLPGSYLATLTVTDNRGASSQDTCQVTVGDTRADLVVTELVWSPLEPVEGDVVTINRHPHQCGQRPDPLRLLHHVLR